MQSVAASFNVSETAFLQRTDSANVYKLRWFTPTREVALCGHATLAAAASLALSSPAPSSPFSVVFLTHSGPLSVCRRAGDAPLFVMSFPLNTPAPVAPAWECAYRSLAIIAVGGEAHNIAELAFNSRTNKLIVRLPDSGGWSTLANLARPAPGALLAVDQSAIPAALRCSGICLTARGGADSPFGAAFASRYFSPWNGIAEDPVNGSSHTVLGPFWAERLSAYADVYECGAACKAAQLTAVQLCRPPASGVLHLRVIADGKGGGSVDIGGRAAVLSRGVIEFPL